MFMFRRTHRRLVLELQRIGEDRHRELAQTRELVFRQQLELALVKQALAKAESDATYWKTRAEKFLDQIALRSGIISEPTMTPAGLPVESRQDTVFRALGVSEINADKGSGAGAGSTAPTVTGVNAADAMAAVHEALAHA